MSQQELTKAFDVACGHFESIDADGGKIRANGVRDIAIVAFTDFADPDSRSALIHAPRCKVCFIYPERHWQWRRVFEAGCHLIEGNLTVGGNHYPDQGGVGGLWTIVGEKPGARPDLISRFMLGHTVTKNRVPDELAAVPEGLYKDISASPRSPLSLYSELEQLESVNRRLQETVHTVFQRLAALVEADAVESSVRLRPPLAWTQAAPGEALQVRWMCHDMEALDRINHEIVSRAKTGAWPLSLHTERGTLAATCQGIVEDVVGKEVILKDETGSMISFQPPAERAIISFFEDMTGYTPRSMKLHVLVQPGDIIRKGDCLYGPLDIGSTTFEQLMLDHSHAQLHAARLWATMSMAQVHRHQLMYPVSVVVPSDIDHCYLQVAGDGWSRRLQRVYLEMHASKVLAYGDAGLHVDGYNCSHRAVNEARAIRLGKLKSREQLVAEKRAKKQEHRQQKHRNK